MVMTMGVMVVMLPFGKLGWLPVAIHQGIDDGPEHVGSRRNVAGQKTGEPGKDDRLTGNGIRVLAVWRCGGVGKRPGKTVAKKRAHILAAVGIAGNVDFARTGTIACSGIVFSGMRCQPGEQFTVKTAVVI